MPHAIRMVALLSLFIAGCAGEPRPAPSAAPSELVAALRSRAAHACNEATAAALVARGVTASMVASIYYIPLSSGGMEQSRRIGSQAWIGLVAQSGNVVVDLDLDCDVRQLYTRDGARLPR